MAVGSRVTLDTRRALQRLRRLGVELRAEDLLVGIATRTLAWIDANFRAGGLERPWPPLRPNTVAGRRKGSSAPLQDTGRLRASFTVTRRGGGRFIEVGTNVVYAKYHEEGTKPYEIVPRQAGGLLRFMTTEGPVFARRVRHPGLPQRRMLPTERLAGELAKRLVDARIEAAAREFNR